MKRIPFSVMLSQETVMALRQLSKKTGLPQWKILTLAIQFLHARQTDRRATFQTALDTINRRHGKTFRSLAE